MTIQPTSTCRRAAALFLLLTSVTPAQELTSQRRDRELVSIDFPGGTLAEFAAALRAAGDNENIVLPEQAAKVRVPAITLRHTTVEAALRALTPVVADNVAVAVHVNNAASPGHGTKGQPVYSVQVREIDRSAPQPGGVGGPFGPSAIRHVRVFSLSSITRAAEHVAPRSTTPAAGGAFPGKSDQPGGASPAAKVTYDVDTVLTAIDTGLSVVAEQTDSDPKATVRYHEDSRLLFVAGTQAQLRTVEDVIRSLEVDAQRELGLAPRDAIGQTDSQSAPPARTDKKATAR